MTIEQRAAALRAMRVYCDFAQDSAAAAAGIGERTLLDAERGRACSEKTWKAMLAVYAREGIEWQSGNGVQTMRVAG